MALEHDKIADNIISEFTNMGIMDTVGDDESSTAKLVRRIVFYVVKAIITDSEIRVIKSTSFGSNGGGPMTSELLGFGKCDIK